MRRCGAVGSPKPIFKVYGVGVVINGLTSPMVSSLSYSVGQLSIGAPSKHYFPPRWLPVPNLYVYLTAG